MNDREAAKARLLGLLEEVAEKKGVELPNIPDSPEREAYLGFLEQMGYAEEELLPVFEGDRVTPEMHGALLLGLMKALESDNLDFVKAVLWMAHNVFEDRDNTNLIIYELAQQLLRELPGCANLSARSLYPGVFPTNCFNAQCCFAGETAVVLLDTGAMQMAEATTISFLAKTQDENKRDEIARAVEQYVLTGARADPYSANDKGIEWGSGVVPAVVNAFESALLAHEFGHLVLGHVQPDRVRQHAPVGAAELGLAQKDQAQEFEADVWAFRALVERAAKEPKGDVDVAVAIAGVWMALGVTLLVEGAFQKHGIALADTHPPAAERLYMVQTACEVLGYQDEIGIGYNFMKIVEPLLDTHFPGVEPPPLLSRELNNKLMPVLDRLGIDYSEARFVSDFA